MRSMMRRSAALAVVLVLAIAQVAFAAVAWDSAPTTIPGNYAWNYSNSMDYTGTPGTSSFKLHDAYISDASLPEAAKYTSSTNGTNWTKAVKVSGSAHAEGSSIAAAGTTVIVGWFTGYSYYDPADAPRRLQVNISTNSGSSWKGVQGLTPKNGQVDYPIVAAAKIPGTTTTNVYAAWVDSQSCDVKFKQSSDGGTTWSSTIVIGTTTAKIIDNAYGCSGDANIAATGNLIGVVWIADDTGTLKVARINLNGNASAATNAGNWTTATLADKISLAQNGYPIASASPLNTSVVTVAYNTTNAQKFVRVGPSSVSSASTIYTNGTIGSQTYGGGYSTVVEPGPGGTYVASWAGCRDVGITNPCNYGSAKAKFDLLAATSTNGTSFTAPTQLAKSSTTAQLNDEPSFVVVSGHVYLQYNAYKSNYHYYDVWGWNGTGSP